MEFAGKAIFYKNNPFSGSSMLSFRIRYRALPGFPGFVVAACV